MKWEASGRPLHGDVIVFTEMAEIDGRLVIVEERHDLVSVAIGCDGMMVRARWRVIEFLSSTTKEIAHGCGIFPLNWMSA